MLEDKIKDLIIEKYGSVRQFALKIDIPYTTIDSILKRGIDNSNVSNVIKMCKALDLSIDKTIEKNDLISNLNFDNCIQVKNDSDMIKIPVLGVIKAGIPIEAQEDIIDYIEIPKDWTRGGKEYYGLKISGDSMYPKYDNDDIVIFLKTNEIVNGKDCAVMVNGFDATFKKVLFQNDNIILQPYNSNYQVRIFTKEQIEQLPVKIIGIAKEKRTKID